jgi:hypothetical protein
MVLILDIDAKNEWSVSDRERMDRLTDSNTVSRTIIADTDE